VLIENQYSGTLYSLSHVLKFFSDTLLLLLQALTFKNPNLDKEFRYTPRVINASQRVNKILLEAKTINRPKEKKCFGLLDV
jgi:hypothetical protein